MVGGATYLNTDSLHIPLTRSYSIISIEKSYKVLLSLPFIMKYLVLSLVIILSNSPFVHSQKSMQDTSNRFGWHLGVNYGGGNAGGMAGGGLLKVCPRIGVNYKERFVLGLEYNSDYQIVYRKDTVIEPSLRLIKWAGPFVRYYFLAPQKKWNVHASFNYVFGSAYVSSIQEHYRVTYNTAFLGLGASYRVKQTRIEAGYRYTFLMNNTPIMVRWTNSIFLGLTWNL